MNGDFAQHADAENLEGLTMTGIGGIIPDGADPLEFLIHRVLTVIPESMQGGTEPLSTIAGVLAQLYQAQALREINRTLTAIGEIAEQALGHLYGNPLENEHADDEQAISAWQERLDNVE